MHRSQGWSEVGSLCKITTETKGPNISILGAITAHGVITFSDFMEFIEQVLTNIEAHDLSYQYLIMDNAAIHKTFDVKDWVTERDVVNKDPASVRLNTKLNDRIKRASEYIFCEDCQAWIEHSLTFWDRCLAAEKGL
ncbi:hypothetical protein INT45_002554 [Circinella minor]|uniref:Tc1-like transposase DDE domain-containing protein n=1 Tax=Circinella minor TaxID=1195481 RepID=A0A8H7RNC4_9FUNG|nr:hypothetical protein INT45_002554 [Circinella minor]